MENEILVKNETEYTYDRYLNLNKFNMYSAKKGSFIILIVSICVIFLCGIFMILLGQYSNAILYLVLSVIFTIFIFTLPKLQTKKIFNSDEILKENIKNTFEFYNDKIDIKNKKSSSTLEYKDLYKAYETKDTFYLYLNRIQVLMVSKDEFEIGDSEVLRKLLSEKIGKKYISKI